MIRTFQRAKTKNSLVSNLPKPNLESVSSLTAGFMHSSSELPAAASSSFGLLVSSLMDGT